MGLFAIESLKGKLMILLLLVALVPTSIVGYLSFRTSESALQNSELTRMEEARDRACQSVVAYLRDCVANVRRGIVTQRYRVGARGKHD